MPNLKGFEMVKIFGKDCLDLTHCTPKNVNIIRSIFNTINFLMYLAPSVCGIKGGADCPYNGHKNQWLFCYHYCKQKHFREGCKPPLQSLSDIPGKS